MGTFISYNPKIMYSEIMNAGNIVLIKCLNALNKAGCGATLINSKSGRSLGTFKITNPKYFKKSKTIINSFRK